MKLLFDQNLSRRLVRALAADDPGSAHVSSIRLDRASDLAIWGWAGRHDFAIVTKDADFMHLALVQGPPPKVIVIALGNCSTTQVERLLRLRRSDVLSLCSDGEAHALVVP